VKIFSDNTDKQGYTKWTSFHAILAFYFITLAMAYFFWISWSDKATNNNHIGEVKVFLITSCSLILGFWYGSSQMDKKRSEVMENLIHPKDGSTTITTKSPDPDVIKANEEVKQKEANNNSII
jgi:hypothetical protein